MTSKQRSLIGAAALLALAATQACGSSDEPTTPVATAGAAPTGAAGASAAGATASGGTPSAGAPATTAGAPGTAAGAGGASAGAPGTTAGAGGASAGSGAGGASTAGAGGSHAGGSSGGASGGSSGGASGASFAAVKTLIGMKCGTGTCHNKASTHLDFQGTTDLHALLTTPIPATGIPNCNGSTLAVAGDAMSLIVRITTGSTMCTKGTAMQAIAKMPDNCTGNSCLTAAQIKVFSDWIAAGAGAQ